MCPLLLLWHISLHNDLEGQIQKNFQISWCESQRDRPQGVSPSTCPGTLLYPPLKLVYGYSSGNHPTLVHTLQTAALMPPWNLGDTHPEEDELRKWPPGLGSELRTICTVDSSFCIWTMVLRGRYGIQGWSVTLWNRHFMSQSEPWAGPEVGVWWMGTEVKVEGRTPLVWVWEFWWEYQDFTHISPSSASVLPRTSVSVTHPLCPCLQFSCPWDLK
jgi:hypothetical protein